MISWNLEHVSSSACENLKKDTNLGATQRDLRFVLAKRDGQNKRHNQYIWYEIYTHPRISCVDNCFWCLKKKYFLFFSLQEGVNMSPLTPGVNFRFHERFHDFTFKFLRAHLNFSSNTSVSRRSKLTVMIYLDIDFHVKTFPTIWFRNIWIQHLR